MHENGLSAHGDSLVADHGWKTLYTIGSIGAMLVIPVGLLDVLLSFVPSGGTPQPGRGSAAEWYEIYRNTPFMALRGQGLLNMITLLSGMPVFATLYGAHRFRVRGLALLSMVLFFTGAAAYMVGNPALPLHSLSMRYATAPGETERLVIAAAGESLLAAGEDFSPGSFPAFFLINLSGLLMSVTLLNDNRFSKSTGNTGLIGFTCLIIHLTWVTFVSDPGASSLALAVVGGLLSLLWYVMLSMKLFRIGRS